MIVWLNGTFGVGKTTTSELLVKALPKARLFDAECVGELLVPILTGVPCNDFQEWDPWRGLVVETAARVLDYVGGTLVIPQTVLVQEYWDEIAAGLGERGIPIAHFVLHAEQPRLRGKAQVIETDRLTPEQVAEQVASLVG